MSDTREIIAERLSTVRNDLGWSINETVDKLKFTRSRYTNWELGYRAPSYDDIEKVANTLGVSPAYLVGWTDQPKDSDYKPVSRTTLLNRAGENVTVANATDIAAYREAYLERRQLNDRKLIAARIDDDAMAEVVNRNDVVLIDMSRTRSETRDLFAILVNDRIWVRWIRPDISGKFTVQAEDSRQYPDETLTPEQLDELNVIGRVARIERDR